MHKRMRMRRRVLQVVVCAAVSWCVVPRAAMAAPQCAEMSRPVPPVVRQTVSDAIRTLEGAGFKDVNVNPANGIGVVVQQNPGPNQCAQPDTTTVDIWVRNTALPPATTVEVPDLRGKSPVEALPLLWMRGLHAGGSTTQQSNQVAPGTILSQQPEAGTLVPKGTAVVVTLAQAVTGPTVAHETLTLKSNLNGLARPREPVTFTAAAQGPAHTIQYQFDFGDGTKSPASSSPQAQHVYTQDGNYTTTVTAILDGGVGQETASTEVSVHDSPHPQVVRLRVSPRPGNEKRPVTFTAHVDPPEPAPLIYTFNFGDKSDEVSETPSVTHAYQQNGIYYPFVTIPTAHKHKASSHPIRLVVVVPPPPVWVIALVIAGVAASAAFLGVVGYKLLQQWVTRGISSKLRLGEVTERLQASHVRLEESESQFHTTHSAAVIMVPALASAVRSVEVRKREMAT